MMFITARVSSRTTAACSACDWTDNPPAADALDLRASHRHITRTGHAVAVLTNTVTVLERDTVLPGPHGGTVARAATSDPDGQSASTEQLSKAQT